jgi:hypothetical protein
MPQPIQPTSGDVNSYNSTSNPLPNQDRKEMKLEYSPAEIQYHGDILRLVRNARVERERPRKEFNDMGFSISDDNNIKLDLAYVPPAKNKFDIRIVSGLTREKTNNAVNIAKSYDFDTEFIAFDKEDNIIRELGDTATDLVHKSNQLEYWTDNRTNVYRGMVARGTYFTLETQEFPTKSYKSKVPLNELGKMSATWTDKPRKGEVEFLTLEIDPKMVILGDIKTTSLKKQPFLAIGRIISEGEARSLFGSWERFKYVSLRTGTSTYPGTDVDFFSYYRDNFAVSDSLTEGEVELVYFMRSLPYGNELAIYLNGTSMLPVKEKGFDQFQNRYKVSGFPLTAISASGDYPLVDWHFERIPNFFYSKGNPAKTKFDQDVLDFWIRFMVKKAVRSINPTLGNKSGQSLSSEELSPSNIISNIRKDDIFSVLPPELIQGVTAGEVSVMEMLKKEIDEKTLSREFAGETQNQHQTATQFIENKKSQLMKLGALVDGIIRGEKRRAELRLMNSIIPYWLSKHDKKSRQQTIGEAVLDIYDTFTVDKEGRDGKFNSVINVATIPEDVDPFELMAKEDREEKYEGKRNKYTFLDPDQIDFIRTLFYVNVKPRERDNNAMQRMMFDNDVITAKNMFGAESTNDESLKVKFAQIRGDDYDTWFKEQGLDQEEALMTAMQGAGTPQPGQIPQLGGANPSNVAPPAQLSLQ